VIERRSGPVHRQNSILQEALMLGNPETDISIAMELNYFRINQAEYFVLLAIKIRAFEGLFSARGQPAAVA
jgi:hypothetical protein